MQSLLAILLGWVWFRATSLEHAGSYLATMFGKAPGAFEFFALESLLTPRVFVLLGMAVLFALVPKRLVRIPLLAPAVMVAIRGGISLLLLLLSLSWLAVSSFNPSIYFQF